jgi:hypothetical protein
VVVRFLIGISLVFGTTLIHLACTLMVVGWVRSVRRRRGSVYSLVLRGGVLGGLVMLMSLAAYLESALWAGFYVMVDALPTFSEAVYFSLVTFTTLGYGDVTLGEEWRMLAALEAANGIMMFGWTTAIIVAVSHRLLFDHAADDKQA